MVTPPQSQIGVIAETLPVPTQGDNLVISWIVAVGNLAREEALAEGDAGATPRMWATCCYEMISSVQPMHLVSNQCTSYYSNPRSQP